MNRFYKSDSWLYWRDKAIKRDLGCDLGVTDLFIEEDPSGRVVVLIARIQYVPATFGMIFKYAFQPQAIVGGALVLH